MNDGRSCCGDNGGRSGERILTDIGLDLGGTRTSSGMDAVRRGGGTDGCAGLTADCGLPGNIKVSCPVDRLFEMSDVGRDPAGTGGGLAREGDARGSPVGLEPVLTVGGLDLLGRSGGSSSTSRTKFAGNTPVRPDSLVPFHQPSSAFLSTTWTYSPAIKSISSLGVRGYQYQADNQEICYKYAPSPAAV